MPKATIVTGKKTTAVKKPSASRASVARNNKPEVVLMVTPIAEEPPPAPPPAPDTLLIVLERLNAMEEKIASGFAVLAEQVRVLKAAPPAGTPEGDAAADTALPLLADIFRRHLMEELSPVTAGMKRLEERIGFVANRLKHGGSSSGGGGSSGQERQKPWRNEQGRHARPRSGGQQNGQQRPPQGQPPPSWTPSSAAAVQGHFAPRPLPGRGFIEEEE
ncbi:MAG: hypothetical protein HYZ50_24725 [Deltaproteobacteria bacterium]|nr:hypothetical protein [Deltaproteobacteria bacterium]